MRYILLPLLSTGLIKGVVHVGLIQPDPLYQFILKYAVLPATNFGK
jgi:auxin efflux carrier family protein